MIHALVIDIMASIGLTSSLINPVIMEPIIVIIGFLISLIIVYDLRKIPVIGMIIV